MAGNASTSLSGVFGERRVDYTCSLEMYPVRSASGTVIGDASVFSYVAQPQSAGAAARPVVFAFNGGPGASSVFLHLSGLGPWRVAIPADLSQGSLPPYEVTDSPHSLLDTADLVFIDPAGTGFGRLAPDASDADADEVYSVEGDARYFAGIIREWTARHDRWDAPKFALGESYGTHRAPFLASALMGYAAVALDGIILLGQALNVQETRERPGNITATIVSLPFQAAVAWYHGAGSKDAASVEEAVASATEFAFGDFAAAVVQGRRLDPAARQTTADRLEQITGVSAEKHLKARFMLTKPAFCAELFGEAGETLGGNDARYKGAAADASAGEADTDPGFSRVAPGFTAGIARVVHGILQSGFDTEYKVMDAAAPARWDWDTASSRKLAMMGRPSPFHAYPYVAELTRYLKLVPSSRLFIGTGYYDPLTTVGAVEHLLRYYDLPLDRVIDRRYEAGHMIYTDPDCAVQLTTDLREFIARA